MSSRQILNHTVPRAAKRAGIVDGDGCLRHPTIKCDSNAICEAARAVAEPSNELATGKVHEARRTPSLKAGTRVRLPYALP